MKEKLLAFFISVVLVFSVAGCGNARPGENEVPEISSSAPQATAEAQAPAEDDAPASPSEPSEPAARTARQDGERTDEDFGG